MAQYYRPVLMQNSVRPDNARTVAGGWCWFDQAERITRGRARDLVGIDAIPVDVVERISTPRAPIAGMPMDEPCLMGILNVTPDSFSDGGKFNAPEAALMRARQMVAEGADILDIGGESTRPGANFVPADIEISRTAPIIAAIHAELSTPISIDTRKLPVALAAVSAGAGLINDVSAFTYEPELIDFAAKSGLPVCIMHAQGSPKNMQTAPQYDDVLLDVYDFLEERVEACESAGIPRSSIMIDPGIGFGKTTQHCLNLLRDISLFHSLGCSILLGASRKAFIGDITNVNSAEDRTFGSVSVAIWAAAQGVQVLRVHDIEATKQAIALQMAIRG